MSRHYKAKVSVQGTRLTFEINDDQVFEDALGFAKKTVSNWLKKHGEAIDHDFVSIKYLGKIHDIKMDELYPVKKQ